MLCHGVARIFLTVLLSYAAVAFHRDLSEKLLHDIKLAASSLFDVGIEVIVAPKIVDDWAFSGWDGGDIGHTWPITACKQEKPCVKETVTGRCRAKPSVLTNHCMRQMPAVREQRWPEPVCHALQSLQQSLS